MRIRETSGQLVACVQTSPLLPIFSDGVGGVCTQAIQLGNLHHPDIYDFYLSEIRETLEPLNYIIFYKRFTALD